jgi:DNA-binding transcriptional LysR family regulator
LDPVRLRGINLNLLVALDALLQARSVTRAAASLGVTQPAMSHSLRQLRELFGDPLLVRTQSGMQLTPRALQLAQPLRAHLIGLERTLQPPADFDPASADRSFRIAAPDMLAGIVVPVLTGLCRAEAPRVSIQVEALDEHFDVGRLETGEIDLALGIDVPAGPGQEREIVYEDSYACLVRLDHARIRGKLSLDALVAHPHIQVTRGQAFTQGVDAALRELGVERRVALELPYFLIALWVVGYSDLLFIGPRLVCELYTQGFPLQILDLPLTLPRLQEELVWHQRTQADPAQVWMRQLVHRTITAVRQFAASVLAPERGRDVRAPARPVRGAAGARTSSD